MRLPAFLGHFYGPAGAAASAGAPGAGPPRHDCAHSATIAVSPTLLDRTAMLFQIPARWCGPTTRCELCHIERIGGRVLLVELQLPWPIGTVSCMSRGSNGFLSSGGTIRSFATAGYGGALIGREARGRGHVEGWGSKVYIPSSCSSAANPAVASMTRGGWRILHGAGLISHAETVRRLCN
jgi:hypothetical protein